MNNISLLLLLLLFVCLNALLISLFGRLKRNWIYSLNSYQLRKWIYLRLRYKRVKVVGFRVHVIYLPFTIENLCALILTRHSNERRFWRTMYQSNSLSYTHTHTLAQSRTFALRIKQSYMSYMQHSVQFAQLAFSCMFLFPQLLVYSLACLIFCVYILRLFLLSVRFVNLKLCFG